MDNKNRRQLFERTQTGDHFIQNIFENSRKFDDLCNARRTLEELHATQLSLLDFNAKRKQNKLLKVSVTMKRNKVALDDKIIKTINSEELKKAKEEHQKMMTELKEKRCQLENTYAKLSIETNQKVSDLQKMSAVQKLKIREAHDMDWKERQYHNHIEQILADIDRLEVLTNTLENLKAEVTIDSYFMTQNRFYYFQHVIENIRLRNVLFDDSARAFLTTSQVPLDGNVTERLNIVEHLRELSVEKLSIVGGILAVPYSKDDFQSMEVYIEEIVKLIDLLKTFVKSGRTIAKSEPNYHLQKLLKEHHLEGFQLDISTVFLSVFVLLLLVIYMKL